MRRRDFLCFLGVLSAGPVTALAQSKAIPKIAIIGSIGQPAVDAFKERLHDQGFDDGDTILILGGPVSATTSKEVSMMVSHLMSQNIDVIFASGAVAGKAAKDATSKIPIVCLTGDLVGAGLVQSLARPGGNITGISILTAEASAKRLELLKENSFLPLTGLRSSTISTTLQPHSR
jgi:putative ABC transport system substrate-binding protein